MKDGSEVPEPRCCIAAKTLECREFWEQDESTVVEAPSG
jgi:hypothetical protein